MRLFVYGTLKRNFCRHFAIASETFLGEARTVPAYRMWNLGSYPGLVPDSAGGRSIQGEVWEVSAAALHRLDEVESVDEGEYLRAPIELTDRSFGVVEAYFYLLPVMGCADCGEVWE